MFIRALSENYLKFVRKASERACVHARVCGSMLLKVPYDYGWLLNISFVYAALIEQTHAAEISISPVYPSTLSCGGHAKLLDLSNVWHFFEFCPQNYARSNSAMSLCVL